MAYNQVIDQMYIINSLKEMYESNNRLLTNITHISNPNFNSIVNLTNNLIGANNEIMRNVTNLLNTNNNLNIVLVSITISLLTLTRVMSTQWARLSYLVN